MIGHRSLIVRTLVFLMMLSGMSVFGYSGKDTPATFLVIHSYNREYRWTEDINTGLMQRLSKIGKPYLVYTEYLDWKRFPDQTNVDNLYKTYKNKYRDHKIDVIIVSDDKALEFATRYRKEIFSNAPIVHTGIFPESVARLSGGSKNITGVYEEQDIRTTLEYALKIQPEARTLYTISDLNESGSAVEAKIKTTMKELRPGMPIWSLSNLSIEEIEEIAATFTMSDIVCVGSYSIDAKGKTYTGETLIGRIGMASGAPVYILNTHHLGTGALGGNLLSPFLLGENAGDLAIHIINGMPADSIIPLSNMSFTPLFDWKTVQRLGLNPLRFPKKAQFINRETPFFVRYRDETITMGLVFVILLASTIMLYLNFRKAKKLANDLVLRNEEITQLNDAMSQADEELRQQYNEITIIKENLERSEERYRLSSIGSNDSLWDWDNLAQETHYSARWYEMTGYPYTREKPIRIVDIMHRDDRERYDKTFEEHVDGKTDHFKCEVRIKTANGNWKWILARGKVIKNRENRVIRFAGSLTDIDDSKQKEAKIENLAYYDQLTSLPNRSSALEIAQAQIAQADETNQFGLMFIDIDNFKYVNDTFGHAAGDKILVQTASILSGLVTENTSIARFGGDEFVALVSKTNPTEMEKYARLTMSLLGRKMELDGRTYFLTISAGVAMYPEHAADFRELFQKADAALHRAKQSGKTRFMFFDKSIQKELLHRIELENGLRSAIENNEMYVAYQPQIDLKTGKIAGLEALARWNNPRKGIISPVEFIPIAEESGQISKIGLFVFHEAVKFLKRADALGLKGFTVSVNVSVKQIQESDFVKTFLDITNDEAVDPARLSLEITESFMIAELDPIIATLDDLKTAGFKLSLDDFGKGYSSLSYLRSLPVNYIKIDKCFIDDIIAHGTEVPLARTIIELSHQLGLQVVAEGVEVIEQLDYLRKFNCDLIQGNYFSKPGSEETVLGQLELFFK